MENEMEVQLLNAIKYTTKDNRNRTILKFMNLDRDSIVERGQFKGISLIDTYYDGFEVFEKIPLDKFGKKCTITIKRVSNPSNPLIQNLKITKIDDIDLV